MISRRTSTSIVSRQKRFTSMLWSAGVSQGAKWMGARSKIWDSRNSSRNSSRRGKGCTTSSNLSNGTINSRPHFTQTPSLISILLGLETESKEGKGVGFFIKPERILNFFRLGGMCVLIIKTVYISYGLRIPRTRSNVRGSCASTGWILGYPLPQARKRAGPSPTSQTRPIHLRPLRDNLDEPDNYESLIGKSE